MVLDGCSTVRYCHIAMKTAGERVREIERERARQKHTILQMHDMQVSVCVPAMFEEIIRKYVRM